MKEIEQDDPMELSGVAVPIEDQDAMAEALIEEYMGLGWSPRQVLVLFQQPVYQLPHRIYHDNGEEYVRARIRAVLERWQGGRRQGGDLNG